MTVGGFTHFPNRDELYALRERLDAARADVDATVALFQTLSIPAFERETEYIALRQPDAYALDRRRDRQHRRRRVAAV